MANSAGNPNWKKGVTGNPNGRPKGAVSIVDAIKRKLAEEMPDSTNKERRTYLDAIVQKIFEAGLEKNPQILKDMIDRVDGKAKEYVEHSGIIATREIDNDELNKLLDIYGKREKNTAGDGNNEQVD